MTYIRETGPGKRDEAVLAAAAAHADGRILLTEDKDFGEWVFAHRHPTVGVILLRYRPHDKTRIWQILLDLLVSRAEGLTGKFTVVTVNKTRIRDITL